MTVKERLQQVLDDLPEDRLLQVLDFAEFLNCRQEREEWRQFALGSLAKPYGDDEPEYTLADVKSLPPRP
jgi:hypothetical protein